ncbi:hypothetical protein MRBLWO14_001134 [Microbacterium sp. LWO14-1.2]|uniref:hypothetical protein n=1 Tax=Microbacterium sp. LWO14-1.2 TaxID=3135263 RepID=UPI003138B142
MEYRGVVPSDAPDPRIEAEARVRGLAFPVMQLEPQPSLTRLRMPGFVDSGDSRAVSFTYTLWRYPDDHSDPRNEIELDDDTRRSIDEEPPWGRPPWLVEQVQMFKYPMLWEAVRTSWHADPDASRVSLPDQLVDHTNHILRNRFREELGLPVAPVTYERDDEKWRASVTAVAPAGVIVDGTERSALHIDTDPFVYAVGFVIDPHVICTTVVARDDLAFFRLALTTFPE